MKLYRFELLFFDGTVLTGKFCEHTDPFCRADPKLLACDGTHIGITNNYRWIKQKLARLSCHNTQLTVRMPLKGDVNQDNVCRSRELLLKLSTLFSTCRGVLY